MKQTSSTQGLILRIAASSESFLKIDLLCPERGVCLCMKRVSKKAHLQEAPDLFDTAELSLETSQQGSLLFVGDYRVIQRRNQIGKSYRTLKYASDFCALIAENGPHMPDPEHLHALTERTLNALAEQKVPAVVFLKALYLLLKDEGYPVKELWWPKLSANHKSFARVLLNAPAPTSMEPDALDAAERLIKSLCIWLRNESDLHLPASIHL